MMTDINTTYTTLDNMRMNKDYAMLPTPPMSGGESPQGNNQVPSPSSDSNKSVFTVYPGQYHEDGFMISIPSKTECEEMVVNPLDTIMDVDPCVSKPSLNLLVQPTDKFRFRYISEMAGTHGSLTGVKTDKSRNQTHPTVQEKGKDLKPHPYPHPHRLIMKRGKEEQDDPHDIEVGPAEKFTAVFPGMGIIHTAKKNIVGELVKKKSKLWKETIAYNEGKERPLNSEEEKEIERLAIAESTSINLNTVCLRFDAFVKRNGILFPICDPIYSQGINNLKSAETGDLKIVRLDKIVSPAKGGEEVFIFVERVKKNNIEVRFIESDDYGNIIWQGDGKFTSLDVHHQYAIAFRTPPYRNQEIKESVRVSLELFRPSDGARSEPRDFRFIPNRPGPGKKRCRYNNYSGSSSFDSDNIPDMIRGSTCAPLPSSAQISSDQLSSEMKRAMQDVDSDEFAKLMASIDQENLNLFVDAEPSLHGIDAHLPRDPGRSDVFCDIKPPAHGIKIEVSSDDKKMAENVLREMRSFSMVRHNKEDGKSMIKVHFGRNNVTNALHVLICQSKLNEVRIISKIIHVYNEGEMMNVKNSSGQTYLHLAVLTQNEMMVKHLLCTKAKVGVGNDDLQTPLHLAVKIFAPLGILEALLQDRVHESVKQYVDLTDGAILAENFQAIKLLCRYANINKQHDKNGFVPLRYAIEKQYVKGVDYLLKLKGVDATIPDFTDNVSPVIAAFTRTDNLEIAEMMRSYMEKNDIPLLHTEIKEEDDDYSDVEEEFVEVKSEIPQEDLSKIYEGIEDFTEDCLDQISEILEQSGRVGDLAELLDITHVLESGIFDTQRGNVSKCILRYAIHKLQKMCFVF
nr:unnamed protein product [Callosobruchus chinensis]